MRVAWVEVDVDLAFSAVRTCLAGRQSPAHPARQGLEIAFAT